MTQDQLLAAPGKILHFPTVLGAVVPVYNIPGVSQELKFTGPLLADIFLGKITKWNDPAITKLNPGVNLPGTDITVVAPVRRLGHDLHLGRLPVEGIARVEEARRRGDVGAMAGRRRRARATRASSGLVSQTPGSLGYVELIYALQNKISYGSVQNMNGKFVKATTESVTAAATAAAGKMPPDFRVSITNAPGDDVYPISSFTWLLLYENPKDKAQSKVMVDFMKWALTDGQKFAADLGYAPTPEERGRHGDEGAGARSRCSSGMSVGTVTIAGPFRRARASVVGTGLFARPPDRAGRRRSRVDAVSAVAAVDPRVRLAVLADGHLGPGRRRVRRAAVHLGHALFLGPRAAHCGADRARDRHLHLRALAGLAADGRWCS